MFTKIKSAFALIVITSSIVSAQNVYNFLKLDVSPRAAAVAGSFVSNGDDPNVMFYNPAGINTLEGTPISFSFMKHLEDINSASLAISKEFESLGRFSAGINYLNYGSFRKTDETGKILGDFNAGDIALIVGYGNELDSNFYYGANVKFINSKISEYSSSAFAVDLGLNYTIPESRWSFGLSVLNLGSQISSYIETDEDLPLDVRFGFSKELERLPFRFSFSFNRLNEDGDNFGSRFSNITLGGEFRLGKSLRLRFGYDNEKRKELRLASSAGLAGFNVGLGFIVSKYNVDYAFSSLGSIGAIHRFGISTSL